MASAAREITLARAHRRGVLGVVFATAFGIAALLSACIPGGPEPMCERAPAADDALYPSVHLFTPSGWVNDPSGLIRFRDRWHAFFQHNPSAPTWGNIHWGHAVSDDLVTWELREPALLPDARLGLPYSGSAVVDEDNTSGLCDGDGGCLVLIFTHALGELGGQKQSLAVSEDGETFTLYEGNPVLAKTGDAAVDFRDPKVLWHSDSGRWVMVVSAGAGAEVYSSPNLIEWTFESQIGPLAGVPDFGAWEVPELFEMTDEATGGARWVFKVDVLPGFAQQGTSHYVAGTFDGQTFSPAGTARALEAGVDLYASMTFARTDDRTLLMGWLSSWDYALDVPTEPNRGFLSLPRELTLRDGVLLQMPVRELAETRGDCPLVQVEDGTLADARAALVGVRGHALDVELSVRDATTLSFTVRGNGADDGTVIAWNGAEETLTLDRTRSGDTLFSSGFGRVLAAPLAPRDGVLRLRVVVDLYSVEIFGGDGEAVITSLLFPRPSDQSLALATDGVVSLRVDRLPGPRTPL